MAGLTRALQDGRHVLRERGLGPSLARILAERRELDRANRQASEQRRDGRARKPGAEELPHDHLTLPASALSCENLSLQYRILHRNMPLVKPRNAIIHRKKEPWSLFLE